MVLVIGYLLVASLAFLVGRITAFKYQTPDIRVEQAFELPDNYTGNIAGVQTETENNDPSDCAGKIKGNIGSSGKIYHLPGGSFYERTNAELCFDTEAQAQAAGFRRSSR